MDLTIRRNSLYIQGLQITTKYKGAVASQGVQEVWAALGVIHRKVDNNVPHCLSSNSGQFHTQPSHAFTNNCFFITHWQKHKVVDLGLKITKLSSLEVGFSH